MPFGFGLAARALPHAVAVFVSVHLTAVLVDVVPYPTRRSNAIDKVTDAREEVDRILRAAHDFLGKPGAFREFRRRALKLTDAYGAGVATARSVVSPYLGTVGSSQRWNMFAGVPPRHPIVATLEVLRCDAADDDDFEIWLDGHAGAPGDRAFDFRERKAQETLYLAPEKARRDYARHWLERFRREHPDESISALRLRYVETTTPPASAEAATSSAEDKELTSVVVDAGRCR
jgi:hypothetical protein